MLDFDQITTNFEPHYQNEGITKEAGCEEPESLEFKLENFSSLTIKDSIGNLITYTLSKFPEMIFLSESESY